MHKILWDSEIQTNNLISVKQTNKKKNRPETIKKKKEKKKEKKESAA